MSKVLWVEDNEVDRELIGIVTEGSSLGEIEFAIDVDDGILRAHTAVEHGDPHRLVVVDLRLGGRLGWEVIDAVRTGVDDPAFVVMTSAIDPIESQRSTERGCLHLEKPITLSGWDGHIAQLAELLDPGAA